MPAEPSPPPSPAAAPAPALAAAPPRPGWTRATRLFLRLWLLLLAFTLYDAYDGDRGSDLLRTLVPAAVAFGLWWYARHRRDRP